MIEAYGYSETNSAGCGIGEFYSFSPSAYAHNQPKLKNAIDASGTGYNIASFIPDAHCEAAYNELAERFHIVYQSNVRKNSNSGNEFFFCVYKRKKMAGIALTPKWPFKSFKE